MRLHFDGEVFNVFNRTSLDGLVLFRNAASVVISSSEAARKKGRITLEAVSRSTAMQRRRRTPRSIGFGSTAQGLALPTLADLVILHLACRYGQRSSLPHRSCGSAYALRREQRNCAAQAYAAV